MFTIYLFSFLNDAGDSLSSYRRFQAIRDIELPLIPQTLLDFERRSGKSRFEHRSGKSN